MGNAIVSVHFMPKEIGTTKNMLSRFFHVWECRKKKECLPLGVKADESRGCNYWNVKASKYRIGENDYLKGNCVKCGCMPRLNLHGSTYTFPTREEAQRMADALNRQREALR